MSGDSGQLIVGRYRLAESIGAGGMGVVWRARDEVLGRDVAVKEIVFPARIPEDERRLACARSVREARAAARLSHPAVITVHDVVEHDGRPWIVMELFRGGSLADLIDAQGPMQPQRVAEIGLCVLEALSAAHSAGIEHRDVKPANVMVSGRRVVLTDFGAATIQNDPTLTRSGTFIGTPAYLAPERARRIHAGPKSDLWSLGATLYAAVEGRPPYRGPDSLAVLSALLTSDPPLPRRAGPLAPVLAGLMRRDLMQRLTAEQAKSLLAAVAVPVSAPQMPAQPAGASPTTPSEHVVRLGNQVRRRSVTGNHAYAEDQTKDTITGPELRPAELTPGQPPRPSLAPPTNNSQAVGHAHRTGRLSGPEDGRRIRRRADGSTGTSSPYKRRRQKRVALLAALVVLVLAVAGFGFSAYHDREDHNRADFAGPGTGSVVVQIKPGGTATTVGARLASLGVVASARAFALAAKDSTQGTALEPGYYHLRKHMKASLAFALLLKPSSRIQTRVTVPEGYRLSQIIAALGKATGNPKGYQQAVAKTASLGLPSFANGNPEGYLFPATYDIQPNTPPLTVLRNMVLRFDQEAAAIGLPSEAAREQLTEGDVIIVASLIQAEGKRPQDYSKIARVIYNRLNQNPPMPLQFDTTVLYALHSFAGDVTIAQTKVNSPYNTYLHAGLPPGPISSPGDAAIHAALHPAAGNWTYFLTVNPKTGLTLFTNSFATFQTFQAELAKNTGNG